MPLLEVRDLEAGYGPIRALDHVSLDVEDGELVALIGANGAGKSTLLNCLSGTVRPKRGSIRFEGSEIASVKPHKVARQGLLHQGLEMIVVRIEQAEMEALGNTINGPGNGVGLIPAHHQAAHLFLEIDQAVGIAQGGQGAGDTGDRLGDHILVFD